MSQKFFADSVFWQVQRHTQQRLMQLSYIAVTHLPYKMATATTVHNYNDITVTQQFCKALAYHQSSDKQTKRMYKKLPREYFMPATLLYLQLT